MAHSLLVYSSPLEQFGATFSARHFTKKQKVISAKRAQDIVVTKDTGCDARRQSLGMTGYKYLFHLSCQF